MWAIRRAANPARNCGFRLRNRGYVSVKSGITNNNLAGGLDKQCVNRQKIVAGRILPPKAIFTYIFGASVVGSKHISSQAGSKSSDEEDGLEDGFSELESSQETNCADGDGKGATQENTEESVSELEVSEDECENADSEDETGPASDVKKNDLSGLFKAISETPRASLNSTLDKWIQEEKPLERTQVSFALLSLRKFKQYPKALQLMEWLQAKKKFDFTERDYASHLDLIAKIHGISRAEKYINDVPKSFRGEVLHRTLLANCCSAGNVKKGEEIFNRMRDFDFPLTAFACNQLLLLYKKVDRKKIADVLLMMEKENVKPSLFTYKLLIDTKGRANDIDGMEQILETMKAEELEPDLHLKSVIARHYIYNGKKEKAVLIMREMEGETLKQNREACALLLTLYAALGNSEEVTRVWEVCEASPRVLEAANAIAAWGKLGKVEKAEEIYERSLKIRKRPVPKLYTTLLKVYGDHKLLVKGKDLMKKISDKGSPIVPQTWDALVNLYLQSGEIEKADSILEKAGQNKLKPFYSTYMAVLSHYAKRGDIHSAEKIFNNLRTSGYVGRMQQYQLLLQAYINAKLPAYGFRERMKADNVFPNRTLASLLAEADALKNTSILDMLD